MLIIIYDQIEHVHHHRDCGTQPPQREIQGWSVMSQTSPRRVATCEGMFLFYYYTCTNQIDQVHHHCSTYTTQPPQRETQRQGLVVRLCRKPHCRYVAILLYTCTNHYSHLSRHTSDLDAAVFSLHQILILIVFSYSSYLRHFSSINIYCI